jgi:hypothetical protein
MCKQADYNRHRQLSTSKARAYSFPFLSFPRTDGKAAGGDIWRLIGSSSLRVSEGFAFIIRKLDMPASPPTEDGRLSYRQGGRR